MEADGIELAVPFFGSSMAHLRGCFYDLVPRLFLPILRLYPPSLLRSLCSLDWIPDLNFGLSTG
ncbi:hypothetical protein EJB05_28897 [Eragrostis curvula]|uniref:Uncharacterized protein n=1 Tax=Eragrostis curvula TaxID=38414 RepID=A0A5J9USJ4_9POAL|nr:hypothetical protein EJB05_28897 [Eragrostis curvula]